MLPTHISLIMSLLLQKSLEDDPSLCRYTLQAPVQKKKTKKYAFHSYL